MSEIEALRKFISLTPDAVTDLRMEDALVSALVDDGTFKTYNLPDLEDVRRKYTRDMFACLVDNERLLLNPEQEEQMTFNRIFSDADRESMRAWQTFKGTYKDRPRLIRRLREAAKNFKGYSIGDMENSIADAIETAHQKWSVEDRRALPYKMFVQRPNGGDIVSSLLPGEQRRRADAEDLVDRALELRVLDNEGIKRMCEPVWDAWFDEDKAAVTLQQLQAGVISAF